MHYSFQSFKEISGSIISLTQLTTNEIPEAAKILFSTNTNEIAAISQFHCASLNFTKIEIGFTWVADKFQRTFVNTEMKYLMLQYF